MKEAPVSKRGVRVVAIAALSALFPASAAAAPPPTPQPPQNVTASNITSTSLVLSWSAVASASSYDVCAGSAPGVCAGSYQSNTSATTFTFTGLTPCTPYTVGVRSRKRRAMSAWVTLSAMTVGCVAPPPAAGLHVAGPQLQDANGNVVRLHGVDRSGTEYACIQGWGIFDGPSDQASVSAIKAWHVNAVRVPLNEDCWLNINGVNSAYGGGNYQTAIVAYVNLLEQNGIYPILDLHWNAPGTSQATGQEPMPDQDHSPAFWQSVANTFRSDPNVIFDLYNEPYPDSNQDTTAAWTCWRDGGSCSGVGYTAAGMQELVDTVRATGADNVIMLGGIQYADALDGWLSNEPSDPAGQLAASWHVYNFNICNSASCWNSYAGPLATHVPVITGELGESDNSGSFITSFMNWADPRGISYLAWTWDTWGCGGNMALITTYSGTSCSPYGSTYQAHLTSTFP